MTPGQVRQAERLINLLKEAGPDVRQLVFESFPCKREDIAIETLELIRQAASAQGIPTKDLNDD